MAGLFLGTIILRKCKHCNKKKAPDQFYSQYENGSLRSECIECTRDRIFKNKYGIKRSEVSRMLEEQHSKCMICSANIVDEWNTDHCHRTGNIRGLLCRWCNLGLGHFFDDPRLLRHAANYLEEHHTAY